MSCSLNSLNGVIGDCYRFFKGDTRSSAYSSYRDEIGPLSGGSNGKENAK